jgi:hypothetical protein
MSPSSSQGPEIIPRALDDVDRAQRVDANAALADARVTR